MTAFNPQPNGTNQQDPHLAGLTQTPIMSWLSNAMAVQQQTVNQQSPYGSASNQYIINSNQDNYLQQLQNYHQSPAPLPSLLGQPPYWSAVPTAVIFPGPPPSAMLAQQQQQPANHSEQHSPTSKNSSNLNRPLTPTNPTDILSTSQPNQQLPAYMNMPRTTQTPGMSAIDRLACVNMSCVDVLTSFVYTFFSCSLSVNYPFYTAAASPTFIDPTLMMSTARQPTGSPALRMYAQQMPIPSMYIDY
jgi:hypothetical protein